MANSLLDKAQGGDFKSLGSRPLKGKNIPIEMYALEI
jgi:hypothetical protein